MDIHCRHGDPRTRKEQAMLTEDVEKGVLAIAEHFVLVAHWAGPVSLAADFEGNVNKSDALAVECVPVAHGAGHVSPAADLEGNVNKFDAPVVEYVLVGHGTVRLSPAVDLEGTVKEVGSVLVVARPLDVEEDVLGE